MAEAEATGDGKGKGGPWDFKFIRSLKNLDRFDDVGGCVMLASPGMLQNGVSRELFERWAPSEKNGVIITGYSVEGTMARQIMQEPDQIQAVMSRNLAGARRGGDDKVLIPRRCSVAEYSFAAHVDGVENREFIEEVQAPVVILVHGEQHNMMRLKSKLLSLNASKTTKTKVFSPRNCEELRIPFKSDKVAKVVGKLASIPPPLPHAEGEQPKQDEDPALVSGVLVQNDFKLSLMAPEDLREYAGLSTTTITCKQRLRLSAAGVDLIKWALEGTFGTIEELPEMRQANGNGKVVDEDGDSAAQPDEADEEVGRLVAAYLVMGTVTVRYRAAGDVELEWEANLLNDGIADSVMAVLFSVESSPAAVKQSSSKHSHAHSMPEGKTNPHANPSPADRLERLLWFLEAQFGADNVSPVETPKSVRQDGVKEEADAEKMDTDDSEKDREIERLHKMGIPVPGVQITVDKMQATVWLEDLEVECNNKVFADRVRAVVERAVEVTAPLWG